MAYSDLILEHADLEAFWPMDEPSGSTFAAAFGSADLTIAGGVTLGAAPLVADGTAAATFARSGSGRAYHGTSYPETDLTVEGWFRCDDLATPNQCLWFDGSGAGTTGLGLFLNGNNTTAGEFYWLVANQQWFATGVVADGDPHHLAFTRGPLSGTVRLYVDGVEVYGQNVDNTNPPSGGFAIGADTPSGSNAFTGVIDDVAVYSAELDAATVLEHYNAGSGIVPPPPQTPHETWEVSIFDKHSTGGDPYTVHTPAPSQAEHYDPGTCFRNVRDYCLRYGLTPDDWDPEIAAADANWIADYVVANGGSIAGYHFQTHSLCRSYVEDGEVASKDALLLMFDAVSGGTWDGAFGLNEQLYRKAYETSFYQREQAFRITGMLDLIRVGEPYPAALTWAVDIWLGYIDHFTKTPEERYGVFARPFMWGLGLMALVDYWFTFRDSGDATIAALVARIPPAVEASVEHIMTYAWWPEGETHPVAFDGGPGWTHGAIKYVYPAGDAETHAPIVGLTVHGVESAHVFIGPGTLSDIDDFYKDCTIRRGGVNLGYVYAYAGAAKRFTIRADNGVSVLDDDVFDICPQGGDDGGGGYAPDDGFAAANPLISPWAAWAYWHRKVVVGDAAGAAQFRAWHEMLWDGQKMAWPFTFLPQKEYNEGTRAGPLGIGYRDAADAGEDTQFESLYEAPVAITRILMLTLPSGNVLMFSQPEVPA